MSLLFPDHLPSPRLLLINLSPCFSFPKKIRMDASSHGTYPIWTFYPFSKIQVTFVFNPVSSRNFLQKITILRFSTPSSYFLPPIPSNFLLERPLNSIKGLRSGREQPKRKHHSQLHNSSNLTLIPYTILLLGHLPPDDKNK